MLTPEQKNAIENLLILVDYVRDNSVYSDEDGKIIDRSIQTAEELIGKKRTKAQDNGETARLLADEIKKRFKA